MNKIFDHSKARIAAAGVVAAILLILTGLAVKADGLTVWKLALGILISLLLGGSLLIRKEIRFPKWVSALLIPLLPILTLCLTECFTHVPQDLTPAIFFLNYLAYLILCLAGITVFGSTRGGLTFGTLVPMIFGLVNYYVVSFRSSPVVPWDFYSLGTAASVADNYNLDVPFRLLFVIFGFVAVIFLGRRTSLKFQKKQWKIRLVSVVLSIGLVFGYVQAVKTDEVGELAGLDTTLFTPNVLYRNNGLIAAFVSNLKFMDVEKPAGYSVSAAEELAESVETEENTATVTKATKESPNIIVIMNEAFSDLDIYGDFETSEDYMPFIHSLKESKEAEVGKLYVSVKGGNTANTEFEFLTGNSMGFLPAGSVPYQQYIKQEQPSLASHLGALGYVTSALHPYRAAGWCRDKVYPLLGFDNTYFQNDFENATKLRGYVDDESAFAKLKELYQERQGESPLFAFEVTMQNHGGYSKEYTDLFPDIRLTGYSGKESTNTEATEKYLTLVQKTDAAFKELTEYFATQDEPTVILMFGDHQPSDYICNPILRLMGQDSSIRETSVDELRKGYVVPYILWSNYDLEKEEDNAISANYLSGYLLDKIGLPLSGYQTWLLGLREEYPVITANFYADGTADDLTFHKWEELPSDTKVHDYNILQYNNLTDWKHRLTNFFD